MSWQIGLDVLVSSLAASARFHATIPSALMLALLSANSLALTSDFVVIPQMVLFYF
jgi:hypothetical protein